MKEITNIRFALQIAAGEKADAVSARLDLVVSDVEATVVRLGQVDTQIEEVWIVITVQLLTYTAAEMSV